VVAALARTRADLELARADSLDAGQSFARQTTLYASGLTSKAELEGAEARLKRVEAAILSAKAAVSEAEVSLENTRIRAPFDGTVLTKDADVGEVVAPFASSASSRGAVVTMADMSSLEVEADVSESNITRITAGRPCEIVLDAAPEKRYAGYVHKIVPTADRAKATVLTKVRFKGRDAGVLPEMSAKVTFLSGEVPSEVAQSGPVLTVPSSAVTSRDGRDVVFLIRGNVVEEVRVKTGDLLGDRRRILEGLASGDQIVLRPNPSLEDGSEIKVK
jgi:RND family efflux transporter MFP subunit